jgi:hypothetical protein
MLVTRATGSGGSDAHGAAFRDDDAVGAGGVGGADDGAEVVRVLDAIEDDDEGVLAAALGEEVVEIVVAFLRDYGDDALMRGGVGHSLEFVAAKEADGDAGVTGVVDDALKLLVGALLGDTDVFDGAGARFDGFADRVNAEDDVHGGKCNL